MAIPTKAILLGRNEHLGTGLQAIRTKESTAIEITDFVSDNACGDSTAAANKGFIIKNNKVYTVMRTFMDLDNKCRYIVAKDEGNNSDIWPAG